MTRLPWMSLLFVLLVCQAIVFLSCGKAEAAATARAEAVTAPAVVEGQGGEARPLTPGMTLTPGDMVRTGQGGHARLVLDDGSSLELFEDSVLELNLVLASEEEGLSFSQHLGHLAADIVNTRSPDLVVTPAMVIGIRGTEFTVSVAEDGASAVSVARGEVSAVTESLAGDTHQAVVGAGQEALLEEPGRAIRPRERRILSPEDWARERRERLEAMLPRLPEMLAHAPGKAEDLFARMRDLAAQLPGHVAAIQEYEAQLQGLPQGRSARREALRTALMREAVMLMGKARRLRVLGGELRAMFVRQERLAQVLPEYEGQLGEEYAGVMAGLEEMAALRRELAPQLLDLVRGVRETIEPVKRHLARVAQALGLESPGGPDGRTAQRGGMFRQRQ